MSLNTNQLRADFEQWSGGSAPESPDHVLRYIEAAIDSDLDEAAALEWLMTQIGEWTCDIGRQLGEFYKAWSAKLAIVVDETQPFATRIQALHWIDNQIGEGLTPADDLEKVAAELRRDVE